MTDALLIAAYISIVVITNIYYWNKMLDHKSKFNDYKIYIMAILLFVIYIIGQLYLNKLVKMALVIISNILICKLFLKKDWKKTILLQVLFQLTGMMTELMSVSFMMICGGIAAESFVDCQFVQFLCTSFTMLLTYIFCNFKWYKRMFLKIVSSTDKLNIYILIRVLLILILSVSILINVTFYKYAFEYVILLNAIICIIFIIITISDIISKNNYKKVYDKYNTTVTSLKEYETILDKYRSINHENKNELMTIRSMTTNKKITNYIDSILDYRIKDNETLMKEIITIPAGGLRGLIYSKLSLIKSNKIKYHIHVDKYVKTVDLIGISNNLMLEVCKIIGVFIDNAIEEATHIKDGYIEILIFIDNERLNISISNNYEGNIDLTKIDKEKYTTKEKGHGYGLALVKNIIKYDNRLENEREITDQIFTQILKIKM